jgi:hypothetical protein
LRVTSPERAAIERSRDEFGFEMALANSGICNAAGSGDLLMDLAASAGESIQTTHCRGEHDGF